MEAKRFNANNSILVRVKEKGIEHYVNNHNSILPAKFHTSCKEFRDKANEDGYHSFQLHQLMDLFGGLGMRLDTYVDINFIVPETSLEEPFTENKSNKN